jgi:hypothetical protein
MQPLSVTGDAKNVFRLFLKEDRMILQFGNMEKGTVNDIVAVQMDIKMTERFAERLLYAVGEYKLEHGGFDSLQISSAPVEEENA